jgi:uncharacterized protein
MKYTLCLTQRCNLQCAYCYVGKRDARMPRDVAARVVDFAYRHTPPDEEIDFGFFGGEPLLEFELIRQVTEDLERHPSHDPRRVRINIATNGTILTEDILEFVRTHRCSLGISCDGPAEVHDAFRRFPGGRSSLPVVAETIRQAVATLPLVLVNAVFHPKTYPLLPRTVEFLASLGAQRIYLNPDYSAEWTPADLAGLQTRLEEVTDWYIGRYLERKPVFISLLDFKIAVILRGGYQVRERCRMGRGEFAFTPEGNIYPCERLIGNGDNGAHCIGHIDSGLRLDKLSCHTAPGKEVNPECATCGLKDYCMNWCGCSNFMSTGLYNRVSPFTCATEKTMIRSAFRAFRVLEEKLGPTFHTHLICQD